MDKDFSQAPTGDNFRKFLSRLTMPIVAVLLATASHGQTSTQVAPAPVQPTPIELTKRAVVFLTTKCLDLDKQGKEITITPSGTAFLVGFADPRLPDRFFSYLVTNRHVAQPGIENGSPCKPLEYFLRVDTKVPNQDGSYSIVQEINASNVAWAFPRDPSVDVAIAPIGINQDKLAVAVVPSTMLLTTADVAKNAVEEGDPVFFTGLFIQMTGQTHSEPIVRQGKIAMMPREQISTTLGKLGDIYLVDCHVFGGNSGSPMFIDLGGQRQGHLTLGMDYRIFGIVSGYVGETENIELQAVASYAGTVARNSGIATVVPAQKILDLLDAPELKAAREKEVGSLQNRQSH